MDKTLGPLVQSFLRGYTKVAVLEASDFVMSPSNRKAFGNANVRLVSSVLDRPLNSLLPPSDMTEKLRTDAFDYIRKLEAKDLEEYATKISTPISTSSVGVNTLARETKTTKWTCVVVEERKPQLPEA